FFFFFSSRRRHTRSYGDWSSDVCSSDLNPLWEYYAPWNFWVRDWREVHEILKPFSNVTNVHGHVHQVLYNEIGKMRSIGMLATRSEERRVGKEWRDGWWAE